VVALDVQHVRGDPDTGWVVADQGVRQRGECGDLVGLAGDLDLSEHDTGVLVDHREQMLAPDLTAATIAMREPRSIVPFTAISPSSSCRAGIGPGADVSAQELDEPAGTASNDDPRGRVR
jgi:hypothetical protein